MRLVMENPTKGLLIALLLCGTCGLALAGSSTGSFSITATVAQTCSVSATSTLAFGAYDPVAANAPPALASACTDCTKGTNATTIIIVALSHATRAPGPQRGLQGDTVTPDCLNYIITQQTAT